MYAFLYGPQFRGWGSTGRIIRNIFYVTESNAIMAWLPTCPKTAYLIWAYTGARKIDRVRCFKEILLNLIDVCFMEWQISRFRHDAV